MIKCTIDKEINGINFKIVYVTQQYNLYSLFSEKNRDYYFVVVNLENYSILKECRELSDSVEFTINNLMKDYQSKQKQQLFTNRAESYSQEFSV